MGKGSFKEAISNFVLYINSEMPPIDQGERHWALVSAQLLLSGGVRLASHLNSSVWDGRDVKREGRENRVGDMDLSKEPPPLGAKYAGGASTEGL